MEIDGPINEFSGADEVASTSCLDESDIDVDIYDEINVPSHLIEEAADPSGYNRSNTSLTCKAIFPQERSFARHNIGQPKLEGTIHSPDGDSRLLSGTPCFLAFPPSVSDRISS